MIWWLLLVKRFVWSLNQVISLKSCHVFKKFCLGDKVLQYVDTFKYLGHFVSNNLYDDADVKRETQNMYTRANTLCRHYGRCSRRVKVKLYRTFSFCLYGAALWRRCLVVAKNSFTYCYNQCIKIFVGFNKYECYCHVK